MSAPLITLAYVALFALVFGVIGDGVRRALVWRRNVRAIRARLDSIGKESGE